jgi:hypothetical protein
MHPESLLAVLELLRAMAPTAETALDIGRILFGLMTMVDSGCLGKET